MKRTTFAEPPRRVALFVTCMVDMLYPQVGRATVALLERAGVTVQFPPAQTCCGQPAFNAGYRNEARTLAQHFLEVFEPLLLRGEIEAIVAPSGSCVAMASHFYPLLFAEDEVTRARVERLGACTFELTEFLVDVLGVTELDSRFPGTLTYHPCCHTLRELGVDRQPRQLLQGVGAPLLPLPDGEACCGFGGLFSVKNGPISSAMGRRKVEHIVQSGADVVALCDVSCMAHINGLLQRAGHPCRARHIAEVLDHPPEAQLP